MGKNHVRRAGSSDWYFVEEASNDARDVPTSKTWVQKLGSMIPRLGVLGVLLVLVIVIGVAEYDLDFLVTQRVVLTEAQGEGRVATTPADVVTQEGDAAPVAAPTMPVQGSTAATARLAEQADSGAAETMPAPAVDATSTVVAASTNSAQGVSTAAFQKGGALEQWIAKDLKDGGWDRTGITAGMVNAAHTQTGGLRTFRVNIVGGKLYGHIVPTNKMKLRGMSRVWYWVWSLLELLETYGTQVPDVDFVMQTEDLPQITLKQKPSKDPKKPTQQYTPGSMVNPPPPLFSAVKSNGTRDLLWPLWTFWGEDVVGAGPKTGGFHDPPWEQLLPALVESARAHPWASRPNKNAFWRGAARTSALRDRLIACAGDPQYRVDASSVQHKLRVGRPIGALDRVESQFLVYMDGRTFSSSMLPMLPTGALVLLPDTPWINAHSRAFRQTGLFEYFDSRPEELCQNITAIVRRAEAQPEATELKVKAAVDWCESNLNIDMQRQYQLRMLQAYAKLQKFTVKPIKGSKLLGWKDVYANVKRRRAIS